MVRRSTRAKIEAFVIKKKVLKNFSMIVTYFLDRIKFKMTTFIALFVIFHKKVFLYAFFISLFKNKHFLFWFNHVLLKELEL